MTFNSLQEIIAHFNLISSSPTSILQELRDRRIRLHPDKNNGEFLDDSQKEDYYNTNAAIGWLESQSDKLVPISQLTELVKTITDLQLVNSAKVLAGDQSQGLKSNLVNDEKRVKRKFTFPKIASTAISVVISFIFLFPSQIQEHPILSKYIDINDPRMGFYWLCALGIAGYVWLLAYFVEHKQMDLASLLESTTYQNSLFSDFISSLRLGDKNAYDNTAHVIARSQLVQYILTTHRRPRMAASPIKLAITMYTGGLVLPISVSNESAESLANLLISRFVEKKVLSRIDRPSIDDLYEVKISA